MVRLAHGVYAMAGVPDAYLTRLRGAYLGADATSTLSERLRALPASGVVSHASAAAVHGLGTLRPLQHEMTLPVRKQTRRPEIRFHVARLSPTSVTQVDLLPVTTVERTAADLLRSGVDEDHVSQVLRDAVERELLDRRRLVHELRPVAEHRGLDAAEWSRRLAPRAPELDSLIEKHYATLLPELVGNLWGRPRPLFDTSPAMPSEALAATIMSDPALRARVTEIGRAARRALDELAADTDVPVDELVEPMLRAGGLDPRAMDGSRHDGQP